MTPWCEVVQRWWHQHTLWTLRFAHHDDADGWDRDDAWYEIFLQLTQGLEQHLDLVDQYRVICALQLDHVWLTHTREQQLAECMIELDYAHTLGTSSSSHRLGERINQARERRDKWWQERDTPQE